MLIEFVLSYMPNIHLKTVAYNGDHTPHVFLPGMALRTENQLHPVSYKSGYTSQEPQIP
jgi:hypothetical protein